MFARVLAVSTLLFLAAGCYGPGVMGWGMNGTNFEVNKSEGTVEVTAVGRGPMKPVSRGAPPEYVDDPAQWDDFALRFEEAGTHVSLNFPAGSSSPGLPAGQPWNLGQLGSDPIRMGDRLFFCHESADAGPYRFGAIMDDSGRIDYTLAFERLSKC